MPAAVGAMHRVRGLAIVAAIGRIFLTNPFENVA